MKQLFEKILRKHGPLNGGAKYRIKIERYLHGELQERDYLDVKKLERFNGPGVTSKVCYDLRKHGKAESEMPSGYSWTYEVVKS